jgi:hypothetical protein
MIGRLGLCVWLAWISVMGSAYAYDSTETSRSIPATFFTDIMVSVEDAGWFIGAPFRFSGRDWLSAAGLVGANAIVMAADNDLRHMLGKEPAKRLGVLWEIPVKYGVAEYATIGTAATYALGLLTGNDEVRIMGRLLGESVALAGTSVLVLRYVAGRSRPYGDNTAWEFKWFERGVRSQSFPSGHSAVAFALSSVFAERIDNTWARIGFYGLASLTSYSLVYANEHWVSDVLIGAGLGLGAGWLVAEREKDRENPSSRKEGRLRVYPLLTGIRMAYTL